MDAITYNSSFDTEDEDFSESEKQTNGSKDNQDSKSKVEIENSSLCEGVRDLRLVTGQSQIESKNKWRLKKNSNSLDKSKLNESYGKSSQKDQFEPRHGFFEAFYRSKRSASCFRGSAAINRKKKLQEIEHNNLILLRKLQNVKPSEEVTKWKKQDRIYSARSSDRSGKSAR